MADGCHLEIELLCYHDDAEMGLLSASVVCQLGFLKLIFLIAGMDDWIKFRNLT